MYSLNLINNSVEIISHEGLESLNIELLSGDGGFYHWCRLPGTLNAQQFNEVLFKHGAAILKGTDCDMRRMGDKSTLHQFFRFSFGQMDSNHCSEKALR